MANVHQSVARAHCYVPRPVPVVQHRLHAFMAALGHYAPLGFVPGRQPCPITGVGTLERRQVGSIVACEFLQYHSVAPASSLSSRLGSRLRCFTPHHPISW
jgi:hypothetical protein